MQKRLIPVLKKAKLPTICELDFDRVVEAMSHDKKKEGSTIHYVYVEDIGSFELRVSEFSDFVKMLKENKGI